MPTSSQISAPSAKLWKRLQSYKTLKRKKKLWKKEILNFEKDLLDIIKLITFRIVKENLQRKLKEDISNLKSSLFSEKIYKLPRQDYKKLLHESITKAYKKSLTQLEKSINLEAKEIAAGVKVDDRIE